MKYYAKSDIGKVRQNNEDSFLTKDIENGYVFLVCDGMGGHNCGEIASEMACDIINSQSFEFKGKNDDDIKNYIANIVREANLKIYLKSKENEKMKGMGTTFSLALVYNKKIYIAHVGDSRIYVYDDSLKLLTTDHTLLGELSKNGVDISLEFKKEYKNYITRALGSSSVETPDINIYQLKGRSKLFICSDGVTIHLDDNEIYTELKKDVPPKEIVEKIISLALQKGGKDNITCLVAEIGE